MKKYILSLCLFISIGNVFSQKLTYLEYFVDTDPGFGLGISVPFSPDSSVKTIVFTHTLANENITNGYHTLSVRVKDENNRWSMVLTRPFYKESLATIPLSNLTAMEYFIDNDPGHGSGTSLSISNTITADKSFVISLPENIANGYHTLSVRVKDTNGRWSMVLTRPFYKESLSTIPLSNLTAMEYFIDNDPGYGAGTSLQITTGTTVDRSFTIALPNTITNGFHNLSVRVKDTNNRWSVVLTRPFYKENLATIPLSKLIAMEYFIDNDPGYGAGTSVNMTADTSVVIPFTAALGNLPLGIHTLYVRVKDANNVWSMVGMRNFEVSNTFTLIGSQTPSGFCRTTSFSISYYAVGTYPTGNVFTAQLSDANGGFTSPINLGSVSASTSGTITAKIPIDIPVGTTYKLRVISSNPSITTNPSIDFAVLENCPPPCPQSIELKNPADNYSNVVLVKEANAQSGWIIANNKISGNSRLTYTAGRSITLLPGFEAGSGTVFLAQKGGCN